MAMFKGFKPQGLQKIANSMGYTGSLEGFDSYLQQNPDKQNMMNMYNQRAIQMATGWCCTLRCEKVAHLESCRHRTVPTANKHKLPQQARTGEGQVDAYGMLQHRQMKS